MLRPLFFATFNKHLPNSMVIWWYGMSCARPYVLLWSPSFLMPLYYALKILSPLKMWLKGRFLVNPYISNYIYYVYRPFPCPHPAEPPNSFKILKKKTYKKSILTELHTNLFENEISDCLPTLPFFQMASSVPFQCVSRQWHDRNPFYTTLSVSNFRS